MSEGTTERAAGAMHHQSLPAGIASKRLGRFAALIALVIPHMHAATAKPE